MAEVGGVEAPGAVVFKGWEPGRSYTKHIVIKNRRLRVARVRVTPPKTSLFSTNDGMTDAAAAKPILVSPGTSVSVPVAFYPVGNEEVEDTVGVVTVDGGQQLTVALRAVVPKPSLDLPERVSFGPVALGTTVTKTFSLANASKKLTTTWKLDTNSAAYTADPSFGELSPNERTTITVRFTPSRLGPVCTRAVLKYDAGSVGKTHLALDATVQRPFLALKPKTTAATGNEKEQTIPLTRLEFPPTLKGQTVRQSVVVSNPTLVPVTFEVDGGIGIADDFTVRPRHAQLKPGESTEVTFSFAPQHPGQASAATFVVAARNGNSGTVTCTGTCVGPQVEADVPGLEFDVTQSGEVTTKQIKLINKSTMPTKYQFLVGKRTAFRIEPTEAVLAPMETKTVRVSFRPTSAGHYLREVNCLVEHHAPLQFTFVGTAHQVGNEAEPTLMPPLLRLRHVERHTQRAAFDPALALASPMQLKAMVDDGEALLNEDQVVVPVDGVTPSSVSLVPSVLTPKTPTPLGKKSPAIPVPGSALSPSPLPSPSPSPSAAIQAAAGLVLSTAFVDFGPCPSGSRKLVAQIPPQEVVATNASRDDVVCWWTDPGADCPFAVEPAGATTVPAGGTVTFRVVFRPLKPDRFYNVELECNAMFAWTRDCDASRGPLALIEPFLGAPWVAPVHAAGHTHPPFPSAPPSVTLEATHLDFPLARVGTPVHRTLSLENRGDATVQFEFGSGSLPAAPKAEAGTDPETPPPPPWSCLPLRGVVAPRSTQLIYFTMAPNQQGAVQTTAACTLNGNEEHKVVLELASSGHVPALALVPAGSWRAPPPSSSSRSSSSPPPAGSPTTVCIKPTTVGFESTLAQTLVNTSQVPLDFDWRPVATDDAQVFAISPSHGHLQPFEALACAFAFAPVEPRPFQAEAICVFRPSVPKDGSASGDHGSDDGSSTELKLPVTLVGQGGVPHLTCTPQRVCPPSFLTVGRRFSQKLRVYNPSLYPATFDIVTSGTKAIAVTCNKTFLAPRTRAEVVVTVTPSEPGEVSGDVSYVLLDPSGCRATDHPPAPLAEVWVDAVYPQLCVVDVRSQAMSKRLLWENFDVEPLNAWLSAAGSGDSEAAAAGFCLDLGTRTVGAASTTVYAVVQNTGRCPVDLSFLFPNDLHYNPEPWAAPDNPSAAQQLQLRLLERGAFDIQPRSAALAAGERVQLAVTYAHTHEGLDDVMPVLLRTSDRPDTKLLLRGRTLRLGRGDLHFASPSVSLAPVAIGEVDPPTQHVVLRNPTDTPVNYAFDLAAVDALCAANAGFAVLTCARPVGLVPARGHVAVPWTFQPLQAGPTELHCPVTVTSGTDAAGAGGACETHDLVLSLQAYDPRDDTAVMVSSDSQADTATLTVAASRFAHSALSGALGAPATGSAGADDPADKGVVSTDALDFGIVPIHVVATRTCYVRNRDETAAVSFAWNAESLDGLVSVSPAEGHLQPGEACQCLVTFRAVDGPGIYFLDMACTLTKDESTPAVAASPDAGRPLSRPTSATRLQRLPKQASPAPDLRASQFKALPPIGAGAQEGRVWYVTVAAVVLSVASFREQLGEAELRRHRIDLASAALPPPLPKGHVELWGSAGEADAVLDVLAMMLADVVHDADFEDAVAAVPDDPPAYFAPVRALDDGNQQDGDETEPQLDTPDLMALNLIGDIVDNTLANILGAACLGDIDLTARPRLATATGKRE
eukprot:m.153179 g.153179  ORF g.153179 m.153179 type:complete len:1710 (-) comp17460_c0_seq1:84-5213(-)